MPGKGKCDDIYIMA